MEIAPYQSQQWLWQLFTPKFIDWLAHETPHFLSNEPFGKDLGIAEPDVTPNTPEQNPNFDWRYDVPGRRFRITETSVFSLAVSAVVNF